VQLSNLGGRGGVERYACQERPIIVPKNAALRGQRQHLFQIAARECISNWRGSKASNKGYDSRMVCLTKLLDVLDLTSSCRRMPVEKLMAKPAKLKQKPLFSVEMNWS